MELEDLRVDDLPLIYAMVKMLGVKEAIDKHIKCHGGWEGPSPGTIVSLWLCYILNECDHRLSVVETWSEQRILLLQAIIGDKSLSSKDFSDDKLAKILDYLSEDKNWLAVESSVNNKGLSIYRLESPKSIPTLRLDSAPMQSHGTVTEGGLLQHGYSKHHNGNLGQFKVQLCSLDNEINHFAFPVSHITVSGEQADDGLYLPLISQIRKQLSVQRGYEKENLYVGDGKMGSKEIRYTISKNEDYYLVPLSKKQLSEAKRLEYIGKVEKTTYKKVEKKVDEGSEKETTKVVAQGFEIAADCSITLEDRICKWSERYLFVQSDYYREQQEVKLNKDLTQSMELLTDLPIPRKGKKVINTLEEMQSSVNKILKDNKLKDLLLVNIKQTKHIKSIRAYGSKPAREEEYYTYEIDIERQEDKIEERKKLMGWQVYATNLPEEKMSFEQCVWKYRYQSNIERQFDNIRNKVVKLLPVYLNKDNRIIGLVNLLMLALKVCCLTEYKVAKALKEQNDELADIYEGNPKRTSKKPSAKRLFKAFDGISIALIFENKRLNYALLTKLEPVQKKILQLLDLDKNLYEHLRGNIQIFFTNSNSTES
jgi:transposase